MRKLNVGIVGGGIGGLQTALALVKDGHKATIFESTKEFLEVGAGIRVPPNSSKLSLSWGVDLSSIRKDISHGNRFIDWKGHHLLDCPFDDVEERYGAPYYFIHRADLINALVDAVKRDPNVKLLMDARVEEYDFDKPALRTSDSQWHGFDLIVCADGIKSTVRNAINGSAIEPTDTGDVAYRILVPVEPLLSDPETRDLVTNPWATHWIGPEAHVVGYPLRGGTLYNIIIDVTHQTDLGRPVGLDEWRAEADNKHLVERFKDWCYPVRKLCGLTNKYLKWKLADFDQLDTWVHASGKAVLLGDASHPFMPYAAQGAAQATEDAATLAAALRKYHDLGKALQEYELQRKPRATYVARNTRVLQQWWHLHDGPERERRDELMKHDDKDDPMLWGYSQRTDWLFGHDARVLPEGGREVEVPELPPFPNPNASVYRTGTLAN